MISAEEKRAVTDLFPFIGERPVVFDVGSNKGHWADVILDEYKEGKCQLHLFEPNKKLLSYSEIKYEYKPNVYFHNVGLLNEDGRKEFYFFENFNNELSSFYKGGEDWDELPMQSQNVEVRKGDTVCDSLGISKIDYVKIDCEGADYETLLGFEKMISEDKIGIVQIEFSQHWSRSGSTFLNLKLFCEKYGYKIHRYIDDNFWEVKEEDQPFDNYFITKFEIHNYSVGGWNANFIANTSELSNLDLVVEIGCFEALTTKYICEKLLNKDNKDARVICIDPLYDFYVVDDPRYHPEFRHQYQRFLRNTRGLPVNLCRGESKDELPKLNALRVDLCFVDGNHYPDWPYHDGVWAFAITKIGGHILFDDYNLWADDTKASIDKFLNEFNGSYEIVQSNYQILIKKTRNQYNEITQFYYL